MDPWLHELVDSGAVELPVLVQLDGSPPDTLRITAQIGDVVSARVRPGDLAALGASDSVRRFGGAREYADPFLGEGEDTDLLPAERMEDRDSAPARSDNSGRETNRRDTVIGVADWGIDFAHDAFRHPDGSTRLEAIWDQSKLHDGNAYGSGVVHTAEQINAALATDDPYAALDYHPATSDSTGTGSHGTHVASIAAGSRESGGSAGVSPDSSLLFVHLATSGSRGLANLGDSSAIVEALHFVGTEAGERPVVFSLSAGRTSGSHNGSSLVERAFDSWLTERPDRAIVQSAGNYRQRSTHAKARVMAGRPIDFNWRVRVGDRTPNECELWYGSEDELSVRVTSPDGQHTEWAPLGTSAELSGPRGATCKVYHRDLTAQGRGRVSNIFLRTGAPEGVWTVTVAPVQVRNGLVHAWVERDGACRSCQSTFEGDSVSTETTIGTIATSRLAIAVGALDSETTTIADFSSAGPTRDGRQKPEIVAPGVAVLAARSATPGSRESSSAVVRKSGTSMAAPYVAGVVAEIFGRSTTPLTVEDVRSQLFASATSLPDVAESLQGAGVVSLPEPSYRTAESSLPMETTAHPTESFDSAANEIANADWPLLAGPIIRRASTRHVYIWLATNQPCEFAASVFDDGTEVGEATYYASSNTVQAGANLFIHLLKLVPKDRERFPRNRVLTYSVEAQTEPGQNHDLTGEPLGLGVLGGGRHRPSFSLPSASTANFIHASCRKLHNEGPDALARAHDAISAHATNAARRPQALFLTGDQVYADDVDAGVRRWATALGRALVGPETIPSVPDSRIAGNRRPVLEANGFTGDSLQVNHVMRFGEFIALYLLAWNEEMWPSDGSLNVHRRGVSKVRKALANIPTYMVFDDHEITDDWNLTSGQRAVWRRSSPARRILANGMSAYWLFQSWGNDPHRFSRGRFGHTIAALNGGDQGRRERELLDRSLHWGYLAPTSPPVVVLDTRTQRELHANGGPGLINASSLSTQLSVVRRNWVQSSMQRGWPLIIVSPAPVLGIEVVELLQRTVARSDSLARAVDNEAWVNGGGAYVRMLRGLSSTAAAPYVVVLSGDVHYASTITADVQVRNGQPKRILQLTSSPSKNLDQKANVLAAAVNALETRRDLQRGALGQRLVEYVFGRDSAFARRYGSVVRQLLQALRSDILELLLPDRTTMGWLTDPRSRLRIPRLDATHALATSAVPIVVSPKLARSYGLGTSPDWVERRVTAKSRRGRRLVHDTNIGQVTIRQDSGAVTHRLLLGSGRNETFSVNGKTVLPNDELPNGSVEGKALVAKHDLPEALIVGAASRVENVEALGRAHVGI